MHWCDIQAMLTMFSLYTTNCEKDTKEYLHMHRSHKNMQQELLELTTKEKKNVLIWLLTVSVLPYPQSISTHITFFSIVYHSQNYIQLIGPSVSYQVHLFIYQSYGKCENEMFAQDINQRQNFVMMFFIKNTFFFWEQIYMKFCAYFYERNSATIL